MMNSDQEAAAVPRCELAMLGCDGEATTFVEHDEPIPACSSCSQRWLSMYGPKTRGQWEYEDQE